MKSASKRIHVIASIVLYNNPVEQITRAIASVLTPPTNPPLDGELEGKFEIEIKLCLIDNSSTPSLASLASATANVVYLHTARNIGYGAGHNLAIKKFADWSDFHLVLNPDISFDPQVLPALVSFLRSAPSVGLVTPQIRYLDGSAQSACKLLPTPADLFFRRFPFFAALTERRNQRYELRHADLSSTLEAPFLSGCFMFFRTSELVSVGGFDERFFLYLEDTDLCRRLGKRTKLVYLPTAIVIHEHQRGSYKSMKMLLIHIRSAIQYFNKWGWFFDRDRSRINNQTLLRLKGS